MPALEHTPDGYQLREHNCPLMRLSAEHVEVCDMVHRWLEALFGARLNRVRCLRLGDPYSAYAIAAGATHIVVGRPVTEASDPAAEARAILGQISSLAAIS